MAIIQLIRAPFSGAAATLIFLMPVLLHAEGLSIFADFEYFSASANSLEKVTGVVSDTTSSRFSQLYQIDISRFVYPNLQLNLGGYYENEDAESSLTILAQPDISSTTSLKTIRPYAEVNLITPLYRTGLAYRTRDAETSRGPGTSESQMVKEYNAVLNWRPVDFPRLNFNYERIELQTDPLTIDSTRDSINLTSKYIYRDVSLDYAFVSLKNVNSLTGSGSKASTHNGRARFARSFAYDNNRFDVNAGARIIYNTTEFLSTDNGTETIDSPAASAGSPFYISNDSPPISNQPFDLALVGGSNRLTSINIGRGGGLNPVSAGLGFGTPVEVDVIYIQLSEDTATFPDLASPSQIASLANSYDWRFYSSDDQVELNWTAQPISSATYNNVDNRFEIRLAAPVNARRVKVTTIPQTLAAPGEIRYEAIRALTSVSGRAGQEPENISQYYDVGLQWAPSGKTTFGYNSYYRIQESKHVLSERTSWTNSLFFSHTLNPIFLTYGRLSREQLSSSTLQGDKENTNLVYSLGLKAAYLETLSQALIFSGTDSSGADGSSATNSILLRTAADLYDGWSMNLDLGYALSTLFDGADQEVRSVRLNTNIVPNNSIDINLDYAITWTDQIDQVTSINQFGTFQFLWALTDTVNMFFRYNFRDEQGRVERSTFLREFNVNWAPFPDGALQLSIGFNESREFGDRQSRSISPTLTWKIGRGIFLDLRYNTGTIESPAESTDLDSIVAKLRFFY